MAPRKDRIIARPGEDMDRPRFRPAASPEGAVSSPQARPVDTFVQPASTLNRNAGQGTLQLAQALAGIVPSLSRFSAGVVQKGNEEQLEAGRQRALELRKQGLTYKQAIDQGLIDRKDSPFYVAGVQEAYGAAMAEALDTELNTYLKSHAGLKESTSLKEWEDHAANFRKEWEAANLGVDTKDKHFLTGYAARAQARFDQRKGEFGESIGPKLEKRSISALFDSTLKVVTEEAGKLTPEELSVAINQQNADKIAQGQHPTQVYRTSRLAIGEAAKRMALEGNYDGAARAARLLERVAGGEGLALANDGGEGSAYFRDVMTEITRTRVEKTNNERNLQRVEQEKLVDDVYAEAITFAYANPNASLEPFVQRVAKVRGAADAINAIRNTVQGTRQFDDERVVRDIFSDIWTGEATVRGIMGSFQNRSITLSTANSLLGELRQKQSLDRQDEAAERTAGAAERQAATEARRAYRDVVSDPLFTNFRGNITGSFANAAGVLSGPARDAARDAEADLTKAWVMWRAGPGTEASPAEMTDWLTKNTNAIISVRRQGLMGYQNDGEPLLGPKPKPGAKPSMQYSDIVLTRQIVRGAEMPIPERLQTLFSRLGSYEAIAKYVEQQAALYTNSGAGARR